MLWATLDEAWSGKSSTKWQFFVPFGRLECKWLPTGQNRFEEKQLT